MELISSFVSKNQYDQIKEYIDGVSVSYSSFCAYSACSLTKEEIKEIAQEKKVFINLNALLHQGDLEEFKKVIDELSGIPSLFFIVSDLGAVNILKKKGLNERTVYQSETMITNFLDAKEYEEDNLYGLGISNEITIMDASKIISSIPNSFYLAYGYRPMYRSYRKIISLWKKEKGLTFENKNMRLQEETRNDLYPVSENEFESVVFRGGVINTLKEIEKIRNAKTLFLSALFIDESKFVEVVKTFNDVLLNKITKEEGNEIISSLGIKEDNSFMYEDSIYEVNNHE
ncbi:MAG: U32 family peptidase [Bacilli bacterium]